MNGEKEKSQQEINALIAQELETAYEVSGSKPSRIDNETYAQHLREEYLGKND